MKQYKAKSSAPHFLEEQQINYSIVDDRNVLLLINTVKQGINYDTFINITKKVHLILRNGVTIYIFLKELCNGIKKTTNHLTQSILKKLLSLLCFLNMVLRYLAQKKTSIYGSMQKASL